jgi:hypothetical protein
MNNSNVRAKLRNITSKVKRPWGEITRSQPKTPIVGTSDTAGKKPESPIGGPQPKDSGHG